MSFNLKYDVTKQIEKALGHEFSEDFNQVLIMPQNGLLILEREEYSDDLSLTHMMEDTKFASYKLKNTRLDLKDIK